MKLVQKMTTLSGRLDSKMQEQAESPTILFKVNEKVSCFCDEYGELKEATILEFRGNYSEAYIHYDKEDKRLDRWVKVDQLTRYVQPYRSHSEDRVLSRRDHERLGDNSEDETLSADIQKFEQLHKEVTRIRNIEQIKIGSYTIKTWYFSPYPPPFHTKSHLFICDHCFRYFATQGELNEHLLTTNEKCPPGREIYRKDNISIFIIYGKKQKICCQCLCLLAKLFLDHKTLFYDVEGFNFYVLCECDENGAHIAAYFSKELASIEGNVLACIVALPPHQKKGYGRLLISISYEIAKREHRSGGPERPLSDLGKIAFHSYWRDTLTEVLRDHIKEIATLDDLVRITSIARADIIDVLKEMNCVTRGKGEYELFINKESLNNAIAKFESGKQRAKIDPSCLIWLPGDDEKIDFRETIEPETSAENVAEVIIPKA